MESVLSVWLDTPEKLERARAHYDRYSDLSARYRDDASLRARIDGGDTSGLVAELGIDLPDGVEARIVCDTSETVHFVMPPDPNIELEDEALAVSAGGKTSTLGSVASLGSAVTSTVPSTVASLGSFSTAAVEDP